MGAAHGLELAMRIAMWDHLRNTIDDREARRAAADKINKLTIAPTYAEFLTAYPWFAEQLEFTELMDQAISFRNHITHHFLDGRLNGLRSERGLKLIQLECMIGMENFRSLESYIRHHCAADFQGFLDQGKGQAEEWDAKHPLLATLKRIENGEPVDLRSVELP